MSRRSRKDDSLTGVTTAGACAVMLAAIAVVFLIGPFVLMLAWNLVVPSVFGGPTIDIWQALGLSILVSVIRGVFSRS